MLLFFIPIFVISLAFIIISITEKNHSHNFDPYYLIGARGISETLIDNENIGIILVDFEGTTKMLKSLSYRKIKKNKPVLIVKYNKDNNIYIVEEFI